MNSGDYEEAVHRLSEAMGWSKDDARRLVDAASYEFGLKPRGYIAQIIAYIRRLAWVIARFLRAVGQ